MVDTLFGSKTRVKLLSLFLNNPGRAFYVRELTREIGEQINSVRRELTNLVNVGVIRGDTVDNKVYYEADTAYQFYESLRTMFSNVDAVASDNKVSPNIWAKKFDAIDGVRVVLFAGKLVYGSDSTVDVLVVGDNLSQIKFKNVLKALERDSGSSLAYTILPFNDFYYRLSVHDQFIVDILNEKHTIVLDSNNLLSDYETENSRKEE